MAKVVHSEKQVLGQVVKLKLPSPEKRIIVVSGRKQEQNAVTQVLQKEKCQYGPNIMEGRICVRPNTANRPEMETRRQSKYDEQKFTSDMIPKESVSGQKLQEHSIVDTVKTPYQCNVCKKEFMNPFLLKRHILIHTDERPHRCQVCGKGFTQKNDLKKHMMIHTGEKPYQCGVCRRTFRKTDTLKTHMKLHSGERPYRCDICKKGFTRSGQLITHMGIHTLPYQCEICMRKSAQKSSMKRHMFVHTGETPHQCEICEKKFAEKRSLERHIKIHSEENHHQCDVCKIKFTRKHDLKNHLRSHKDTKSGLYQQQFVELSLATSRGQSIDVEGTRVFDEISIEELLKEYQSRGEVFTCETCGLIFRDCYFMCLHVCPDDLNRLDGKTTNSKLE